MDIREIEKIIDAYHTNHAVFKKDKKQTLYDLVSAFEDLCSIEVMCSMLNPFAIFKIREHMDALNQALIWVEGGCENGSQTELCMDISEDRYTECVSLLNEYAYQYSVICSGYISFSRNRMRADIQDNRVDFSLIEETNTTAWSDILRESKKSTLEDMISIFNPVGLSQANQKLKSMTKIEDERLCYELDSDLINTFESVAEKQWEATKTLPDDWEFDLFTLDDYRRTWICIAAWSYIHFFAKLSIQDPLIRMKNGVIVLKKNQVIEAISSMNNLSNEVVERVIDYITYEPGKRNGDIMYQPIVNLGEMIMIAPFLFMGASPERNLLSVVASRTDFSHSNEVNNLEDLMVKKIEQAYVLPEHVYSAKHKNLEGRLPDIDFALYDDTSNVVLLCELKWFAAADSTKEVYAREDDIDHGCMQVNDIMTYALQDKEKFVKKVFGRDDGENVDLFCCVVARHNIRTSNKYVPVIDLDKFISLLVKKSISQVCYLIRNHEYEDRLPSEAKITKQNIKYADYEFLIPAICFGEEVE